MPPHLVHIFPSFNAGGAQVRTVQILNRLGDAFRHTLVALDGHFDAATLLSPRVRADCMAFEPLRNPLRMGRRYLELLDTRRPDLLLTYNFGTVDAVAAAALRPRLPVLHTEDGFGPDEARGQKSRRVWYRRLVLRRAQRVVAPSHVLFTIMRHVWRLPAHSLAYVPNGVDTGRFRPAPRRNAREVVIGTVGQLRPEKCHDVLLQACEKLARERPIRVVIAGDGSERPRLEQLARTLGLADRVLFLGHCNDPAPVYASLDVFALSSSTEQMPLSLLEAMAAGLPVAATGVGDVREMVSEENRPCIVSQPSALTAALRRLADEPALRGELGDANRRRAVERYSLDRMLAEYGRLYEELLAYAMTQR